MKAAFVISYIRPAHEDAHSIHRLCYGAFVTQRRRRSQKSEAGSI